MSARPDLLSRVRKAKGPIALLTTVAIATVISLISLGAAGPAPRPNLRGVVGGDFHAGEALSDWGAVATLQEPAAGLITDDDVYVSVDKWKSGDVGQTQPTTTDTGPCTGTPRRPIAPEGKVCIYVEGGDNAIDVNGYSARPGVLGSRYGFKLSWTNAEPGDTFIDAIWVYNAPK